MSYEPTTWKSGDVVTSSKLNKMEQGIANAGGGGGGGASALVVTDTGGTLDHTWQEIHDAAPLAVLDKGAAGIDGGYVWLKIIAEQGGKYVSAFGNDFYLADSADGYPELQL